MRWASTLIRVVPLLIIATVSSADPISADLAGLPAQNQQVSLSNSVLRRELETYRRNGDIRLQRQHVWSVLEHLTEATGEETQPFFEAWFGEDAAFANTSDSNSARGLHALSRKTADHAATSADAPILTYTFYNDAAYQHLRTQQLQLQSTLKQLRAAARLDDSNTAESSIEPFPANAIVLKTAWWPVAREHITALPVWDADSNEARHGGNPYITWTRVVAVDPTLVAPTHRTLSVDFAGRRLAGVRPVGIGDFYHLKVDADLASRLGSDEAAAKLALIALGRPITAGDYLVLVGANLATKEIEDWVWAAVWWHDAADVGPYAADRPPTTQTGWRHYLMQTAFDEDTPIAFDGGPHVCFNPWLEGRFPDGGEGGGMVSNCMACHRRASYPPVNFLPVTRGAPQMTRDSAFAPGQLRTNFIWSIPLHANP